MYVNLHENYDELPARIRAVVDRAYNECAQEIRNAGLVTSNTDDAERLVDAIAAYIRRSNPARREGWTYQAASERAAEEMTDEQKAESRRQLEAARAVSPGDDAARENREARAAAAILARGL
jgi:hypothetical protein